MRKVLWQEGLLIGPEHFNMQNQMDWDNLVQVRHDFGIGEGIGECLYDEMQFERGIIKWNKLLVNYAEHRFALGNYGVLQPSYLEFPEAIAGCPEYLEVYLEYSGKVAEISRWVNNREVVIEEPIWIQSFSRSENSQGLTICRFIRKGPQWFLDEQYMPLIFRLGKNMHGDVWLRRIRNWLVAIQKYDQLTMEQKILMNVLQLRSASWGDVPVREVWSELLLAVSVVKTAPQLPPWNYLKVSQAIKYIVAELESFSENRTIVKNNFIEFGRVSAQVYNLKIQADDWINKRIAIRWYKKRIFGKNEIDSIKIAATNQLQKLVRASLSGIKLSFDMDIQEKNNEFGIQMIIDTSDPLWNECLLMGGVSLYCLVASDYDSFWLGEV